MFACSVKTIQVIAIDRIRYCKSNDSEVSQFLNKSLLIFIISLIPLSFGNDSFSNFAEARGAVVIIQSTSELYRAFNQAESGSTLLLSPGDYKLTATLANRADNLTIRGSGERFDEVRLLGPGMSNPDYGGAPHAIWSNAVGLTVENLSIQGFYQHGIILNPGAQSPTIRNVRIVDTGQQMIKANTKEFGDGVNDGVVEYSVFAYTGGPPTADHGGGTGYTNGIDVHAGADWVIRNNRFENFHTPDGSDHLWNPAVLMWNGARNSVVENNEFYNVDRAIAFGLLSREHDHFGGVIANNYVEYDPGLYSLRRRLGSDGSIIVWNSPETVVRGNTILTRGNLRRSIEFRFDTDGGQALDNTVDAPIGSRGEARFYESGTKLISK